MGKPIMPKMERTIDREALVCAAREARQRAYAPYSKYRVGAALLTADGTIYTGCNVENASYPASICAERVAMTKAVSEGRTDFVAIAIVTSNAGTPCGICRQVMSEFAPDMRVIVADLDTIHADRSVDEFLPYHFDAGKLDID
jgi:cytidine deaminase